MTIGFLSHLDLNLYAFRLPIMKVLKERGERVYAICPEGEYTQKIKEAGIEVISYNISRQSLNPLKEILAIYDIYNVILPLKLDILHTFTAKPNIYGTIAGKIAGVKHIVNLVEGLGSFYLENNVKSRIVRSIIEMLYKKIFQLSDKVMFVNNDDPEYLITQRIISQERVVKIHGVGIDTQLWKSDLQQTHDKKIVLMVGRAIRHKGVKEFYEVAKMMASNTIEFWYVGGIDKGNPSSMTEEEMNVPYVKFWNEQSDIPFFMSQADVFVLPSYREGLPRTILEAMALQKAVVATDCIGSRDVVTSQTGLLVPIKDSHALKDAIVYLLTHDDIRIRMGQEGRKRVEQFFDIQPIIKAHVNLYDTLMKNT